MKRRWNWQEKQREMLNWESKLKVKIEKWKKREENMTKRNIWR